MSLLFAVLILFACTATSPTLVPIDDIPVFFPTPPTSMPTLNPTETVVPPTITATPKPTVPHFDYIVMFMFENKEFGKIIGSPIMPIYNKLSENYSLLTQYYAVRHPSLPNYIAMMGGDTFGISDDCTDCFVNQKSLPDLIEASGRTWKTYQEDMPSPCFVGNSKPYYQKHNPFIYFDSIRTNQMRCEKNVVPFTALQTDINAGALPNFIFITPNICNDAHDCTLDVTDEWLTDQLNVLMPALDKIGKTYLIILNWDEGSSDESCCGLPDKAGGRIPVILMSSLVKNGFQDDTPYTHYSLLKTISEAWGLPYLGHAADINNPLIVLPWK